MAVVLEPIEYMNLPAKVDAPAAPARTRAQIRSGEKYAEDDGDGNTGAAGARHKSLHDGIECRKAQHSSDRTHGMNKALESVTAESDLFGQGSQREKRGIGQQPAPGRRLKIEHNGDAAANDHGEDAGHSQRPAYG